MTKKQDLRTGHDFVKLAQQRNAYVERKGNFTAISTRNGKVFVKDGHDVLDKQTQSNLWRWFKLLGLLVVIFFCVKDVIF